MQKISLLLCCFLSIVQITFAQNIDTTKLDGTKKVIGLSSSAGVTNNGISLVPTFTLDKPAAIFDMSVSKSKFSFEPEVTFSLSDGKPWYLLFWFRYKIANNEKFKLTTGAQLGLNFKRSILPVNGDSNKVLITERYLAGELSPNYYISKNISVGAYYLLSHGLDRGTSNFIHFLTLNANFSNIKLSNMFYMKFVPQFYYLKIDHDDGFYFTSSLTFAKYNFPLSVAFVINEGIKTNINTGKNFVWNITLTYSF
jgi:hypothetical protein